MRIRIETIILGLLAFLSCYLYLFADIPSRQNVIIKKEPILDVKSEEQQSIEYLNELRVNSGLIPLKINKNLKKAARNHANYLIQNQLIGHYENQKREGFTGTYGSDRSLYAGYKTSMVIENISNNNFTHKESIDGLMAAIYHRFGFLDFHIDEIGIAVEQHSIYKSQTAFVYDMGSHRLEKLCIDADEAKEGKYIKNICANRELKIKTEHFNRAIEAHKYKNRKVITYPYNGQRDIPPAFYDELPDPLPEYSVSGFPISMSFNESFYKKIDMLSFKIFDKDNREITDTIIYDHKTDPNRKLKKFEFALFPLHRLSWNSYYIVKAVYRADGVIKKRTWQFKTRDFTDRLESVTDKHNSFTIRKGEPTIFYFPPKSKKDILGSLKYPAILDISFIDKNTIKLTANNSYSKNITLKIGNRELKLSID